jgi:oxygen-dependent protoporphyrinogen oxidase
VRAAGGDPDAPIFAAPAGGIARLPAAVADAAVATGRVEILLGVGVAAVEPGPTVVLDDGRTLAAAAVVVATPGPAAARALAAVAPDAAALLGAVKHVSVAFVRLALPPSALGRPLDGSGVLVPRRAGRLVTACSWASSKWAHLAPEAGDGTTVLRAAVGRDDDQGPLALDDTDLVAAVVDDLTLVLDLRGGPAEASVHRWSDAFPQYRPGHLERMAAAEAALPPTVALAGMFLRGVGIPASIASAHRAADQLLAAIA